MCCICCLFDCQDTCHERVYVSITPHAWAGLIRIWSAFSFAIHRYLSSLVHVHSFTCFFFLLFCSNSKWDILDLVCTYRQTKNRQIEKNMNSWEKRNIYTAKHKCLYRVRSFHLASGELLVLHFIAVALSGIDCFAHLIMLCVIHATSISRSSALHSIDCGTVWHSHIGARWGEHAQ